MKTILIVSRKQTDTVRLLYQWSTPIHYLIKQVLCITWMCSSLF